VKYVYPGGLTACRVLSGMCIQVYRMLWALEARKHTEKRTEQGAQVIGRHNTFNGIEEGTQSVPDQSYQYNGPKPPRDLACQLYQPTVREQREALKDARAVTCLEAPTAEPTDTGVLFGSRERLEFSLRDQKSKSLKMIARD
jgi:hypothetical protein